MKYKKIISTIALLMAFVSQLCALSEEEYQNLLQKAEDNTSFYETDFKGSYTVVQNKPGEGQNVTEAIMYRRDRTGSWTILVTAPAREKGKGYLQFDNNIWFFDPADRRFTFTNAKDKFQNTNAHNSDFAPQHYARDYFIEKAEETTLSKMKCVLFTLSAKTKEVDYPKLKLWVTKDDGLVRKKEEYSLSGQKLRTTAIPSYQLIKAVEKNYSIPVSMLIQDNLKGKKIDGKVQYEQTQITIRNVIFEKVSDTIYTKPYLELMSAK